MKVLYNLLIIILFVTHLYAQSFSDSLLLHYNFSNGQAIDLSGNGFHGIVNATSSTDRFGIAGKALHFNGIDEFVELPNVSELKPQLPVSIAFWVKFDTLLFKNTWVFNSDYQDNLYSGVWAGYNPNNSLFSVEYGDGGNTDPNHRRSKGTDVFNIYTKTWYLFVAVVMGPLDMDIYIDCEIISGVYSGNGGALSYSSNPGYIGLIDRATTSPDYFMGDIDELWYWNRAITPYDINEICNITSESEINKLEKEIKIFPNPTSDQVTISLPENFDFYRIDFYNSLGILTFSSTEIENIDLNSLSNGVYVINVVNSNNGVIGRKSFIKL
ncbi:MAG: LamG-like jellyroll fold domain-containing protein [Bacteroidota bacterium]